MNELTVRITLLLSPGLVAYYVYSRLTGRRPAGAVELFCIVFVFTLTSYASLSVVHELTGYGSDLFRELISEQPQVRGADLAVAVAVSVAAAYIGSALNKWKAVNAVGRLLRVSTRHGDEDLWHFLNHAPAGSMNDGWLVIRDHATGLLYYACIEHFSETGEERELILGQVSVHDNGTGEHVYEAERLYLCRNRYDLTIEVPERNDDNPDDEGAGTRAPAAS